jgi:hypothetical protein
MNEKRSIFRPTAVAHYRERREQMVFPRPIATRTITLLWLALFAALAVGVGVLGSGDRSLLSWPSAESADSTATTSSKTTPEETP